MTIHIIINTMHSSVFGLLSLYQAAELCMWCNSGDNTSIVKVTILFLQW